jgi:hypothetical protein
VKWEVIQGDCPACGRVEVELAHVWVILRNTEPDSAYAFFCPKCQVKVERPATLMTIGALMDADADVRDLTVGCVTFANRPPLTETDVHDFVERISDLVYLASHARRESVAWMRSLRESLSP